MTVLLKPLFLGLLTILGIVLLGCLLDTGFIYYQATRGIRLPFKLNLVPRVGSDIG